MLCLVLGSLIHKRHGQTGESPTKGYQDEEGTGAPLLQGKAERVGTVYLGIREVGGGEGHINVLNYVKGGCNKDDRTRVFSVVHSDRTRDSRHYLRHRRFPLNIKKHFFTVRVTNHWHRLSRELMESPSLEIFKRLLKVAPDKLL